MMTYSNMGKKRRLDRLFINGKTLIVPVDDSLIAGPKEGLKDLQKTLNQIISCNPNAIIGFKGALKIATSINSQIPFIYNITASTTISNHTTNDIIVMGAKPLTVQDAIICGKLEPDIVKQLVKYISEACSANGSVLTGGETSEQPGVLSAGTYVLTSSIVGVVDKKNIIDGSAIVEGDTVLALASNGIHTNGYSFLRKLMEVSPDIKNEIVENETFLDFILKPHNALIKQYENYAFLRMPNGSEYAGYAYSIFNNRIHESRQLADLQSDDHELCYEFRMPETATVRLVKPGEEDINLTAAEFKKLVGGTTDKDYKRAAQSDDNRKWYSISIPQEAIRGVYEKSTLFSVPNTSEFKGSVFYAPSSMVKEDKEKQDGSLILRMPENMEIKLLNREDESENTINAEELFNIFSGSTEEDFKSEYKPEETWADFDTACKYAKENGGATLAYALDGKDNIACIDIDHCINESGEYSAVAKDALARCGKTYIETSVSGTGVHIFGKTKGADLRTFSKDGDMEYYRKAHFIAMTGSASKNALESFDNPDMQRMLEDKFDKRVEWKGAGSGMDGLSTMSDREVLEKAFGSKNGETIKRLYNGEDLKNNHSNSDMSLMDHLAFWCHGDKEQILRIFATSGLYRPDKSADYYEGSIIKAIKDNTERYNPPKANINPPRKTGGGNGKV